MKIFSQKNYVLLALFIFLMTSVFSIITPLNASAAVKTLDDYTKSFIYYKAWEKCMSNGQLRSGFYNDHMTPDNVSSGAFFNGGKSQLGYVGIGASSDCNVTGEWLTSSLRFWSFGTNTEAICKFGFTRDALGGGNSLYEKCMNGSGNFYYDEAANGGLDRTTATKRAIEVKYYNQIRAPQLSAAQQYKLYYKSFVGLCEAKPIALLSSANPDQKTIADSDTGYILKILDENYNIKEVIFQANLGKGRNIDVFSGEYISCSEIVNRLNSKANEYKTYMRSNKSIEESPPSITTLISTPGSSATGDPGATTCAIDGIGWIVCPVVTFLSFVADKAFGFLADNFLVFDANYLIADSSNVTFTAWQQMLVFANIGLVIFFILIIFSQITGFGISNYGIKKMLPKLIITVILMNLSFFIVQIAADLSNILGYSLKSFFGTISEQYDVLNVASFDTTNGIFSGIALTVLGGAGAAAVVGSAGGISGALVAFLPILLAGLIALIMIFFILIARQVLLILLTVLAPIAFLAYLLPNTEKWFTRWYKTLIALLMVFPIVGLVYGASDLASQVIGSAMQDSLLGSAIGAAVITLPLFLVPIILKKSLDSIPALSGKINSLGSRFSGKATGSAKDSLGKSYMGQKAAYNRKQADIRRAQIQGGSGTGLRSRMYGAFNASSVSGRFGDQAAARGAQIAQSQEEENIKNAAALLSGLTSTQMSDLAKGNSIVDSNGRTIKADRHTRRAALREAGKYATADDAHELMKSVAGTTGADRLSYGNDLVSALSANAGLKQSAPWIGGATYGSLTDETRTSADFEARKLSTEALSAGKISASQVASMGAGDIDGMRVKANDALTEATAALSSARTQEEIDKANAAIAQANTAKDVLRSIGVQVEKDGQLKQQVPENSTKAASIHDLTLIP